MNLQSLCHAQIHLNQAFRQGLWQNVQKFSIALH
jgi:hypothetical protein